MTTGLAGCAYNCTISEVKTERLDVPSSRTGSSKLNWATYSDPILNEQTKYHRELDKLLSFQPEQKNESYRGVSSLCAIQARSPVSSETGLFSPPSSSAQGIHRITMIHSSPARKVGNVEVMSGLCDFLLFFCMPAL